MGSDGQVRPLEAEHIHLPFRGEKVWWVKPRVLLLTVAVTVAASFIFMVRCVLVLPAFNVTLTPRKTFLKLDDTGLEVEISARWG